MIAVRAAVLMLAQQAKLVHSELFSSDFANGVFEVRFKLDDDS